MPRKEKGNHGARCKPLGDATCTAALNRSLTPACVTRPCPKCGERRCQEHCGCRRRGESRKVVKTPKAKAAARRATAAAAAQRTQPPVRSAPVLPLRQALQPSLAFLGAADFWDTALKEVAAAKKTVFVASLVYDNSKLQTKLLAVLARGVTVEVLVDRVSLGGAPWAEGRLKKLKKEGAKVSLASGKTYEEVFGRKGQPGVYHAKVVVVDRAVALVGSCNSTNSSLVNGEVVVKVTGAEAAAQAYAMAWAEAQRVVRL